jgi:hypothetical protein
MLRNVALSLKHPPLGGERQGFQTIAKCTGTSSAHVYQRVSGAHGIAASGFG